MWNSWDLTKFGRAMLIKTLGISQLIYSVSNLDAPKEIVEIVRKSFKFLWKNKKDKIKRSGLYQDSDNSIPYLVASETYVWSFQYRILNFILFTNDKLFKIGLSDSDKCSFCGTYTEDLYHLFFNCSFVQAFWNIFTVWWSDLSGEYLTLSLKDIMVGLLQRNDLLNYLIILGKLTIWECRKNNTSPLFRLFLHKVEVKKQVEKIIAIRNRKLREFHIRWELLI